MSALTAYREEGFARSEQVLGEMKEVVKFLHNFRKYSPIVAGGALWSWSANQRCRDADIFVKDKWFLEGKLLKEFHAYEKGETNLSNEVTISSYFGSRSEERELVCKKFSILLSASITPADIVLCPDDPADIIKNHFDYQHCKVGFGEDVIITEGADPYSEGRLIRCYGRNLARSEEKILSKVQPLLWGKDVAKGQLMITLDILRSLYKEVSG